MSVLSSALNAATRQRRILHNPAERITLPKVEKAETVPWSTDEALTFLEHVADDRLARCSS